MKQHSKQGAQEDAPAAAIQAQVVRMVSFQAVSMMSCTSKQQAADQLSAAVTGAVDHLQAAPGVMIRKAILPLSVCLAGCFSTLLLLAPHVQ
jgi:hypothetical protein